LAILASIHILFIVSTTASAMRANYVTVILKFKVGAGIEFLERHRDF